MTMTAARIALKARLLIERRQPQHLKTMCELCEAAPATDLHEVIITRGAVRGHARLVTAITEMEENVALLCHKCHMEDANAGWAKALLTVGLILRYGSTRVISQINKLGLKNPRPYVNHVQAWAKRDVAKGTKPT